MSVYSEVPNKCVARLLTFGKILLPKHHIWTHMFIGIQKKISPTSNQGQILKNTDMYIFPTMFFWHYIFIDYFLFVYLDSMLIWQTTVTSQRAIKITEFIKTTFENCILTNLKIVGKKMGKIKRHHLVSFSFIFIFKIKSLF